jgi:hypothetical protein
MNWEEDKLTIVKLYFECIDANNRELFSRLDKDFSKSKAIYQIVKFIDDRLSAVWFLAINDMLWDADIIDRSVLESLIKLNFIVYAPTDEEKQKRLNEFWNDLWEINSLKHSEQSKKHLNQFTDKVSQLAHLSIILTDKEEEELKNKWSRKDRKALEQKWSFSEILFSLIKDYKGQPFEMMIGLAHEYRMCSHIAHGDETGINIIAERKSRPDQQKQIVHRGHFIKLLSNCLAYASWTSIVAMDFLQADKKFFFNNHSKIEQIKDIEKYYHEEVFYNPDYDKYK